MASTTTKNRHMLVVFHGSEQPAPFAGHRSAESPVNREDHEGRIISARCVSTRAGRNLEPLGDPASM
jgi:hypothetical protein